MLQLASLGESYGFPWDIMQFVLEGNSPIDLPELSVVNRQQAQEFLLHYGYNLSNDDDAYIVRDIYAESLGFIKTYFCSGMPHFPHPLQIPADFERLGDCRDLLLMASDSNRVSPEYKLWACAILRVMHTIHYVNHVIRYDFFNDIKRQVLENFRRNINLDSQGNTFLGSGPAAVPLCHVYYKEEKERDSVILKLLQKPKNVNEKIHDRLGVKLITKDRLDALLALRYLLQSHSVVFANIVPGRSRNTLLNLADYHGAYVELLQKHTQMTAEERDELYIKIMRERENSTGEADCPTADTSSHAAANRFSSVDYHSIQFTVQQIVKLQSPSYFTAQRLRVQLERYHLGPDLEGLLKELEGPTASRERRILFPLEVQILDYDNYIKTIEGNASHAEYKRRQTEAAFVRVLGPVYRLLYRGEGDENER